MSRIPDLGDAKNQFSKLPALLKEYEDVLKGAPADIKIEGKRLEVSNREQASLHSFYDERRVELKIVVEYLEAHVAKVRGNLFNSFKINHSIDFTDRGINELINRDETYLQAYELLLEVKEVYEKYVSVVDAFQARGFALRNITQIRVAALEDVII